MIESISKYLHVPFLVIHDAHDIKAIATEPEAYISMKLLKYSSNDIEKATSGIVVLSNVNQFNVNLQRSIAKLIKST